MRLQRSQEISATVYVFPSPTVTSFASPEGIIVEARERLCQNFFLSVQREVTSAHPDAELLVTTQVALPQGSAIRSGHKATYRLTNPNFFGRPQLSRSEAHVFCYAGGKWTVEYRFDYPDDYDAANEIAAFMRELYWTIREQP